MTHSRTFTKHNKKGFKYKLPIILAFVLPVLIMLVLYVCRGIFPFGENMFLRSDMYHQYAPFMKEFQRNIQEGGSLLYSWNIGLGTNFVSTYAYYLASPTNWISFIFPDTLVPEFMNIMLILKAGLMSCLFTYYVIRKFKRNDLTSTAFGCFYAMSSYMAAFSWNVMWLDCLVLLPLILMGLEALVKEGKIRMYTITLAVCIVSNYYISIMICIFLVFYFIYLMICEGKLNDGYDIIQRCCYFVLYSILAGCMAMFVVLPAFFNLFITASAGSAFPKRMTAYYNVLEMLSKSVINTDPAVFSGHFPNIYSSMSLFMLLPMYWFAKRISWKEKAGKTVLVCLLAFSFMFNIPTYIWHGFHFPNSLPCRYSFIFIFLTLVMGYEALLNIRRFKVRTVVICALAAAAAVFALQTLYSENMTVETASIAGIFIIMYMIVGLMIRHRRIRKTISLILLLLVAVGEIVVNTYTTGYSTTSRTVYMEDNDPIIRMLEKVDDGSFYRTEKVTRRTKNDGTWLDYKSASIFSSTTVAGDSDLYSSLGMQGRTNAYSYYGHTPITQALLGIRYEIANAAQTDPLMNYVDESEGLYLYENKHVLSLGYMVDSKIKEAEENGSGPFGYQNNLIASMTGVQDLYSYVGAESTAKLEYTVDASGRFLAYITSDIKKVKAEIVRDGAIISSQYLDSLETPQIIDLEDVQKGDIVTIESNDSEYQGNLDMTVAVMDYNKYEKTMQILESQQLNITEYNDTSITGTVNVSKDGVMFTTVPYDTGWSVYVDGSKISYTDYADAFITFELTEGLHDIQLKYWPSGFTAGVILSIAALAIFAATEAVKGRKKHKKVV